jgi:hypothetical protein
MTQPYWPASTLSTLYQTQVPPLARQIAKQAGKQMVIGLVMIALGVSLTVGTYIEAKPGGTYAIFWGLVLAGLIRFGSALRRRLNATSLALSHIVSR